LLGLRGQAKSRILPPLTTLLRGGKRSGTKRVPVTLAAARAGGYELGEEYRRMTSERRTGELLPEHLVAQQAPGDRHLPHRPADADDLGAVASVAAQGLCRGGGGHAQGMVAEGGDQTRTGTHAT